MIDWWVCGFQHTVLGDGVTGSIECVLSGRAMPLCLTDWSNDYCKRLPKADDLMSLNIYFVAAEQMKRTHARAREVLGVHESVLRRRDSCCCCCWFPVRFFPAALSRVDWLLMSCPPEKRPKQNSCRYCCCCILFVTGSLGFWVYWVVLYMSATFIFSQVISVLKRDVILLLTCLSSAAVVYDDVLAVIIAVKHEVANLSCIYVLLQVWHVLDWVLGSRRLSTPWFLPRRLI